MSSDVVTLHSRWNLSSFVKLNIHQRFADVRRVIDIVVDFSDDSIVARCDRHICLVRLNFTNLIELFHSITEFNVPEKEC